MDFSYGFYFNEKAAIDQYIKAKRILALKLLVPDDYFVLTHHLVAT